MAWKNMWLCPQVADNADCLHTQSCCAAGKRSLHLKQRPHGVATASPSEGWKAVAPRRQKQQKQQKDYATA